MFETPNAVRLRVALEGITPGIWRDLIVPTNWTLAQLHLGIQAAFNWWNSHLHEFRIGGLRYGDLSIDEGFPGPDEPRLFDENEIRLLDFERDARFTYIYDFGDDWRHSVTLDDWLHISPAPKRARCVAGARARPPEDVGGPPGYERFLEIIADRTHEEYADILRWCGGYFDPEWFDVEIVDKDMASALRPNVRRRLHQPKPAKPSKLH